MIRCKFRVVTSTHIYEPSIVCDNLQDGWSKLIEDMSKELITDWPQVLSITFLHWM